MDIKKILIQAVVIAAVTAVINRIQPVKAIVYGA